MFEYSNKFRKDVGHFWLCYNGIRPHKINCLFRVQIFLKLDARKRKINKTPKKKTFLDILFSGEMILKIGCARGLETEHIFYAA